MNRPYTYPRCPVERCGNILLNGGRCPRHGSPTAGADTPPPPKRKPAKR